MTTSFHLYKSPEGARWRVERGAELLRDYDLATADLPEWHRVMSGAGDAWEVICRVYAVFDVIATSDPVRMAPATEEEAARALGRKPAQVGELLKQAREYWQGHVRRQPANLLPLPEAAAVTMTEEERAALLLRYDFIISDPMEATKVAKRCVELKSYLENDLLRSTAISLMQQERHLAALDDTINTESKKVGDARDPKEIRALLSTRAEVNSKIEGTLERLGVWDTPDALRKKTAFSGSIGGVVEAIQSYYASGDRALIDGVFTEGEVEVLTREFDLRKPQYRPDLVAITAPAAIENLWNPNFEAPRPPRPVLRQLAKAFRVALADTRRDEGRDVEELDQDPERLSDDD